MREEWRPEIVDKKVSDGNICNAKDADAKKEKQLSLFLLNLSVKREKNIV